jgi:hypothetical protein
MLKKNLICASLLLTLAFVTPSALAQTSVAEVPNQSAKARQVSADDAIERTRLLVEQIVKASYPELKDADIQVQIFRSESDYFRTIFSFKRFLSGRKMRYYIKVNPRVFQLNAPEDGVRAILAHELGHVFDFHRKKRIRLFGLLRLASKNYTVDFERRTDLQAISRGYGEGLKAYRQWLYRNIPAKKMAEKRRNYFSPEEIEAIEAKVKQKPEWLQYFLKYVPRNLQEIVEQK